MSSAVVNARFGPGAILDRLVRLGGPVLTKELRVASRRRRTYALRFVYLAALTAYVAWAWTNETQWYGTRSRADALRMTAFAEGVTARILLFQFVALPAIAIVMLSTSVTEEIQRRTLSVLMTTPVSAFSIVLGKLASQVFQLALLLAISLPLLVLLQVFGGVPREAVAVGLMVTLTTCILAGSVSMLVSTVFRRAYVAVLVTVVALLVASVVVSVVHVLVMDLLPPTMTTEGEFIAALDPIRWLMLIAPDPTRLLMLQTVGSLALQAVVHVLVVLGLSALLLAWTARRLRRVGLRLATGELRPAVRWEQIMRLKRGGRPVLAVWLRRVTGSPVLWRETQVRFGPSRMAAVVAWAVTLAAVTSMDALAFAAPQFTASVIFTGLAVALWILTVLVAVVQPAPAIAGEREAGTLALLLATPLSRWRIVLDKALAAIWRSGPIWMLLAAHLVLFVVLGVAHPIVIVHVGLVLAGTLAFVTGAGLLLSAYARRTASAMAMNVGVAALAFVAPLAVGEMSGYTPNTWTPAGVEGMMHPACHVYMATQGAVLVPGLWPRRNPGVMPYGEGYFGGNPPPTSSAPLRYLWPYPLAEQDWVFTSLALAQISLVWLAAGCLLGALAARRLGAGDGRAHAAAGR